MFFDVTVSGIDSDGDNITDLCDIDDDNDGILDSEECTLWILHQLLELLQTSSVRTFQLIMVHL